jgi:hypothetical protein
MAMIEAETVRSLLEQACPELVAVLATGDDQYSERLLYLELADVARWLGKAYASGATACLPALFATVERCILEGTPDAISLVVIGLLEDLQNSSVTNLPDFTVLEPYFGRATQRAWEAVDRFWAGDTDALRQWAADSGIELT